MSAFSKTYIRKLKKQFKNFTNVRFNPLPNMDSIHLKNGYKIILRPPNPADAANLLSMHRRLSASSRYFRFLRSYVPDMAELAEICNLPPEKGAALIAERNGSTRTIVAMTYYIKDTHNDHMAEFAIAVEDDFQGQGLGRRLFANICIQACINGVTIFKGHLHPQNKKMLHLLRSSGYPVKKIYSAEVIEATVLLTECSRELSWSGQFRKAASSPFYGCDAGLFR